MTTNDPISLCVFVTREGYIVRPGMATVWPDHRWKSNLILSHVIAVIVDTIRNDKSFNDSCFDTGCRNRYICLTKECKSISLLNWKISANWFLSTTPISASANLCMCVCLCVSVWVCECVNVCVCVWVCLCMYVNVCVYVFIFYIFRGKNFTHRFQAIKTLD